MNIWYFRQIEQENRSIVKNVINKFWKENVELVINTKLHKVLVRGDGVTWQRDCLKYFFVYITQFFILEMRR